MFVSLYVVGLVGLVFGLKQLWCVWWLAPVESPGRNGSSMSIQAANVHGVIFVYFFYLVLEARAWAGQV